MGTIIRMPHHSGLPLVISCQGAVFHGIAVIANGPDEFRSCLTRYRSDPPTAAGFRRAGCENQYHSPPTATATSVAAELVHADRGRLSMASRITNHTKAPIVSALRRRWARAGEDPGNRAAFSPVPTLDLSVAATTIA